MCCSVYKNLTNKPAIVTFLYDINNVPILQLQLILIARFIIVRSLKPLVTLTQRFKNTVEEIIWCNDENVYNKQLTGHRLHLPIPASFSKRVIEREQKKRRDEESVYGIHKAVVGQYITPNTGSRRHSVSVCHHRVYRRPVVLEEIHPWCGHQTTTV